MHLVPAVELHSNRAVSDVPHSAFDVQLAFDIVAQSHYQARRLSEPSRLLQYKYNTPTALEYANK